MDINGDVSLFRSNLQQNTNLFSQPNPADPEQTRLYFEKKFSDIFSGFLNTSLDPNSSDMLGSSSSSNELDFFWDKFDGSFRGQYEFTISPIEPFAKSISRHTKLGSNEPICRHHW